MPLNALPLRQPGRVGSGPVIIGFKIGDLQAGIKLQPLAKLQLPAQPAGPLGRTIRLAVAAAPLKTFGGNMFQIARKRKTLPAIAQHRSLAHRPEAATLRACRTR